MASETFNLLEWYAANRQQVAVLHDPNALFSLGLLDQLGTTPRQNFQNDLGWDDAQLDATIDKLYGAGFISTQGTSLAITPRGQEFLTDIGLRVPPPPTSSPEEKPKPEPPRDLPKRGARAKPNVSSRAGTPWWLYGLIGVLVLGAILVFSAVTNFRGGTIPTATNTHTALAQPTNTRVNTRPPLSTNTPRVPTPTRGLVLPTARTAEIQTSIPETQVLFVAEPNVIVLGQCALLRWHVTNAQEIFLQNRRVLPRSSFEVCPRETTTYTLRVMNLVGQPEEYQTSVRVNELRWGWTFVDASLSDTVREGLTFAVDVPRINDNVFNGLEKFHQTDPKLDTLPYDPERARLILKQSGFGGPIYLGAHQDDISLKIAEYMSSNYADIFIPVKLTDDTDPNMTIYVGPVQ